MAGLRLETFNPLPWQAQALREILRPGSVGCAWAGGKGSGKSALVSVAACMIAATRPGCEVALVMDSYKSLRDIHLPLMSSIAASCGGEWRATDTEFRWSSGSVVRLRHLDTSGDPRIGGSPIEGMNLHALIADECQQIDGRYFTVWQERTRVTAVDLAGQQCAPVVVASGLPVSTWWCADTLRHGGRVWRPQTRDNTFNDPGYEARVRATMTERQARAMLDGHEWSPEGQIVEEYVARLEPDGVLTDWTPTDRSNTRFVLSMDLGGNNPHAILAAEDVERGRWVVLREWFHVGPPVKAGTGITLGAFCRRISADCVPRRMWGGAKDPRFPLDEVIADPAGAATSAQTGHSDLDLIASAPPDGLGLRPHVETIPERRSVVGSLNRMRLAIERRKLMFSRAMVETPGGEYPARTLHGSLLGYSWDPRGRDEPMKDGIHDHGVDCLRYLARRVLWHLFDSPGIVTTPQHGQPRKLPAALAASKGGR